ncbi:hypothetical protein ACWGKW_04010 [Streptomyces sp. NPDC054766]|uniref:hypothetical protein n=1 Tax=Streptomyces rhizosphaerihabitans TaxID=1266770 RepID=UPI0021BF8D26|nr:hypothetical protein [Streptomyces rhizosphaerihabitans]MCT9008408.1 hypothetical protein [Streptomyces rhizosphaerihabitans]
MSEYEDRRPPGDEKRPEHEHKQSHAGNGTVNHGPDEQPDSLGTDGLGSEGLGSDELALRRLLHQAVQEIEPTDGTLDHLRRAVPARRARKRQAVVGMAAAALFIGTAIPALVHVSNSSGSNADPSIAANSSQAQGGANQGKGSDGGGKDAGGSAGTSKGDTTDGQTQPPGDKDKGAGGAATGGADPSASASVATTCTADQLGGASGTAAAPDSNGAVYGSFTVSNISTTACTVAGAGTVSALAQGAADAARIGVATHVAGDAATGLPDASTEVTSLVLQPGTSYVVKFAWVPSSTCPATADPSPDPTPTEGATDTGGTTTDGASGTSPQLLVEDGVQDGSVIVSSTAATGGATASVTVSNACAGTVYHTGILASS